MMGKYQYMNLEQKLAKIRKKMPLLLKKNHNDEENYDFATLDDIYESLTPALNQYGVNFDIVKETPGQYDAGGNPVYMSLDKDGYWRYESDLELSWTNIDNPKEVNHVVMHIVGTHEIPDKAHGTALTYGLKYYFRNKFCMRQLGSVQEDPDGMEYGTEEGDADAERNSSSRNENGKGSMMVTSKPERESGKERQRAAKPERNQISGNAIPEPKGAAGEKEIRKPAEPDKLEPDARKDEGRAPEQGGADRKESMQGAERVNPSVKDQESEQKNLQAEDGKPADQQRKTGNQQAKADKQPEETKDSFHTASEGEVPFEDGSFLDELEQEMEQQTKDADSGLEAAKKYVCTFGLYNGKTLGEMMNSGLKCREAVKWIANRYKGTDQGMVAAAKLLLENQDLVVEQQAA